MLNGEERKISVLVSGGKKAGKWQSCSILVIAKNQLFVANVLVNRSYEHSSTS
jgi:hypothetical protein